MEGPEIDTGTCGRGAFRTIREASRGRLKHLVPSLERLFPSLATAVLAGPAHGEDGVTKGSRRVDARAHVNTSGNKMVGLDEDGQLFLVCSF